MTTLTEIKKWTRPLLAADPNLVLIGRSLFLKPVRHVLRGVLIDRTSSAEWSRVHYALIPLFDYPQEQTGFRWSNQLNLGRNTEPGFAEEVVRTIHGVIAEVMSEVETIGDFVTQIGRPGFPSFRRLGDHDLATFPQEHCVVLAAMGRMDQASAILAAVTSHEADYRDVLFKAEAERAKHARSAKAKSGIEWASAELRVVGQLLELKKVVDRDDRAGVGRLLRQWERQNARLWGVEHLWEPTPFPVEELAEKR